MTPLRTSIIAIAMVTVGFLSVSQALLVQPSHPMSFRTDVFFQSDAGGLLQDAVEDRSFRARGTHPMLYALWTWPLHRIACQLEPTLPREWTVCAISRLGIALTAGLGFGLLTYALRRRGEHWFSCLALAWLAAVVNGNTIAAIPDHFGLSTGLIAACFAVMLLPVSEGRRLTLLGLLAVVMFGVTITNLLLPFGMMSGIVIHRYRHLLKSRIALALLLCIALVVVVAGVLAWNTSALRARVTERIGLYLNWRIVDQPSKACEYTLRGFVDCGVAPTPQTTLENLDHLPMLTYEPRVPLADTWPYDPVQTVGVCAWIILLFNGIRAAVVQRNLRFVSISMMLWLFYNAAFHNFWGDEYFLYSPHMTGPLLLLAAVGFHRLPKWLLAISVLSVSTAAIHTLIIYHTMLLEITI